MNREKFQENTEENTEDYTERMRILGNVFFDDIKDLRNIVESNYRDLVSQETKYAGIALKLGVNFENRISHESLEAEIQRINDNIRSVQREIYDISQNEDNMDIEIDSEGELENRRNDLRGLLDGISYGHGISKQLPGIIQDYEDEALAELKAKIYERIKSIIRDQQIKKLSEQRKAIQETKTTFFDKLTGKDKLRREQIQFINLQIKGLEQPIEYDDYSIVESIVEIKIFSIGKQLPEMQEIEESISQVFTYDQEEVDERLKERIIQHENLSVEIKSQPGIFQIREETKRLKEKNRETIQELRSNLSKKDIKKEVKVEKRAVTSFKNILHEIGTAIKDDEQIQEEKEQFAENSDDTEPTIE